MEVTCAQNQQDFEEIADLKGKIFKRATYYEFYEERMRFQTRDPWFQPEHALIVRDAGKIVSHVTLFERPLRFGPSILKTAGIGDVLTIPDYRGKGLSSLIMRAALDLMQEQNFDLTMLFGIPNYYHKFGYIEAMSFYQLELLNLKPNISSASYQVRPFDRTDLPVMLELYCNATRDGNLVVDRSLAYLESKQIEPQHVLVLTHANGQLAGYALTWDRIKSQFAVIEAITENHQASLALLAEIYKRKPATDATLKIKMSPQMPFVRHVRYLGTEMQSRVFGEGEGKGMLAIVDLCRLLNKFKPLLNQRLAASCFHQFSGRLEIHCQQSVALDFENGTLHHCQAFSPTSTSTAALITDLRYFTRNVIGFWSISDLLEQTEAQIADEMTQELFGFLFPKAAPFLLPLDYF